MCQRALCFMVRFVGGKRNDTLIGIILRRNLGALRGHQMPFI